MPAHIPVGIRGDRVDMGRILVNVPGAVHLNHIWGVDGQLLVGVHGDHDVSDEGVDGVVLVAGLQVRHEGLLGDLVEKDKVCHSALLLLLVHGLLRGWGSGEEEKAERG